MEISKAVWTTDSDVFNLSMSISKVDEQKRLVFGWATLDNPDLQDDVVTFEASKKAFSKFRGNLREMHQKIAAGRMVDYRPQKYVDDDGNIHNGIFVAAYVSEGAESTWKKVLDGTLQAFSINGPVNKARSEYNPQAGKVLRYIDDYDINELSLVDAGGNPLTNLVSFTKDATGEGVVATGELTNVEVQNVFLCKTDNIVETSETETLVCQNGHDMKNIGWVEGNTAQTMEKVNSLVKEHIDRISKTVEGGVEVMAEEVKTEEVAAEPVVEETKAVTVEEAAPVEEAPVEEVKADEAAEEVAPVEGEDAADQLEKALGAAIEELRAENGERFEDVMKSVDSKFEEFKDDFAKRFAALEEQQTALSKSLESVVGDLGNVSKSVSGLNDASATRKSGDLGGEPEGDVLSKSNDEKPGIWSGAIL